MPLHPPTTTPEPTPTPTTALVFGEALVDVVTDRATTRVTPGGSPLNIAVGLSRMGIPVTFATQFGEDEHGRLIAAHLAGAGVTVDRAPGRTSRAHATLTQDGSARYQFDIHWDRARPTLGVAPTIAHIGSIAAFRTPGRAAVSDLFEHLPRTTLRTFDPNIRPALLEHEAASAQFERLARQAHVVKFSDEDAAWLFPGATVEQVLSQLLTGATTLAVMTQGAAGSVLAGARGIVQVAAPEVTVVDTIGAGDAYMSGLLFAALHSSMLPLVREAAVTEEILEQLGGMAAASAAVAVSHAGAHPPTPHELQSMMNAGGTRTIE